MDQLSDNDEHSWSDGDTPTPMFATHGWSDTTLTSSLTGRSSFGSWEEDEGVCKLPEVTGLVVGGDVFFTCSTCERYVALSLVSLLGYIWFNNAMRFHCL